MLIKTSELTGAALDWAVAITQGWQSDRPQEGQVRKGDTYRIVGGTSNIELSYRLNWAYGGPLIDKYSIQVSSPFCGSMAHAYVETGTFGGSRVMSGKTTLEAICRAVVYHCMGDEVEIPDALLEDY